MKQDTVQGSQTQRNTRSSMSDPDMFLNYTPTYAAGPARYSFSEGVHAAEGSAMLPLTHAAHRFTEHTFVSANCLTYLPGSCVA